MESAIVLRAEAAEHTVPRVIAAAQIVATYVLSFPVCTFNRSNINTVNRWNATRSAPTLSRQKFVRRAATVVGKLTTSAAQSDYMRVPATLASRLAPDW